MMSTRSPGRARPLRPATSLIGIVTARLPRGSTAARKPRSPGWTMAHRAIGTPCGSTWRATLPARKVSPAASASIIWLVIAESAISIRARRSGLMIVPTAISCAGTNTSLNFGASTRTSPESGLRSPCMT